MHIFNGTVCEISSNNLKHIGAGYQGHVFSAEMNCPNNGAMQVAVKVVARPKGLVKDFRNDTWVYQSLEDKHKKKFKALYKRLTANATHHHHILNNFALTFGTVDIPSAWLSDAVKMANQDSELHAAYREVELDESQGDDDVLVGEVTELVPGGPIYPDSGGDSVIWTPDTKRLIVKDLIRMFRHMYDRMVAHDDIFGKHVFFSPFFNRTTLIDFGYAKTLDQKSQKEQKSLQQREVWNMLSVIGNLCMHQENRFKRRFGKVYPKTKLETLMKRLIPALEKCNFNQTMAWNETSILNTEETFQALADWSSS